MKTSSYKFLFFIFEFTFLPIQSLVEIPAVEDNNIEIAEFKVNDILNDLFSTLKLKSPKRNPKIGDFNIIHNYFTAISQKYHDHCKYIARMASTSRVDSKTKYFIMQLNAIFDDDSYKNNETSRISHDENKKQFEDKYTYREESNKIRLLQKDNAEYFLNTNISGSNLTNEIDEQDLYESKYFEDIFPVIENTTKKNTFTGQSDILQGKSRRIFGGKATNIRKFPFVASIQITNKFQCAGSIIESDLVITAASCLQLAWNNRFFRENPNFLTVRVGSNFVDFGGEVVSVLEIYFHPAYDPKTLINNLAILRLQRVIKLSKTKKARKIGFDRDPTTLRDDDPPITILGWGAKGMGNTLSNPYKTRLAYTPLSVYPLSECQDIYSRRFVTTTHFCAGFISKGNGACNHDIGGPGISGHVLVGVVSFGFPVCGTPDKPTVFTKLGFYTDWIDEIMEQDVVTSEKQTTKEPLYPYTIYKNPEYPIRETTFKFFPILQYVGKLLYSSEIWNNSVEYDD